MLKINIVVENEIEYICFKTNKKYIIPLQNILNLIIIDNKKIKSKL